MDIRATTVEGTDRRRGKKFHLKILLYLQHTNKKKIDWPRK